jgi:hypothetical protein
VGDLAEAGAAPADARLLALKVAYLERVNAELRHRLRRIEKMAYLEHEHG